MIFSLFYLFQESLVQFSKNIFQQKIINIKKMFFCIFYKLSQFSHPVCDLLLFNIHAKASGKVIKIGSP